MLKKLQSFFEIIAGAILMVFLFLLLFFTLVMLDTLVNSPGV